MRGLGLGFADAVRAYLKIEVFRFWLRGGYYKQP